MLSDSVFVCSFDVWAAVSSAPKCLGHNVSIVWAIDARATPNVHIAHRNSNIPNLADEGRFPAHRVTLGHAIELAVVN